MIKIQSSERSGDIEENLSAAIGAHLLLSVLTLIYGLAIFAHLTVVEIIATFAIYHLVFSVLVWIFILKGKRVWSFPTKKALWLALFIVFSAIILYSTHVESQLPIYAKKFPLHELDAGFSWHSDTAFHVALIKSIIKYGYPSIALHGTPLTAYHALTHYLDAMVSKISGADVFVSYGMLALIKATLFFSAVLFSFAKLLENYRSSSIVWASIVGLPLVIGTWHPVLSHGMWAPCLILVLAMPFVIQSLYKTDFPTWKQLLALIMLCIVCGLGKVSTGFMLAAFIGCWLVSKNPINKKTNVFGLVTATFFYVYGNLFISEINQIQTYVDLSQLKVSSIWVFYTDLILIRLGVVARSWTPYLGLLWCLFLLFAIFRRNIISLQLLLAASGAMLLLWALTSALQGLSVSDVLYFTHGLIFPLLFVALVVVMEMFTSAQFIHYWSRLWKPIATASTAASVIFVFLNPNFKSTAIAREILNVPAKIGEALITEPFAGINKHLPTSEHVKINDSRASKQDKLSKINGAVFNFKQNVQELIHSSQMLPSELAMYLPIEVFDKEIISLKGDIWAYGMLIYSVIGVQLVHGAPERSQGYGLSTYATSGKLIKRNEFNLRTACTFSKAHAIIVVEQFSPPSLQLMECSHHD